MPRTVRAAVGDVCYHVINRGNGRMKVFHAAEDHENFLELLALGNKGDILFVSLSLVRSGPQS